MSDYCASIESLSKEIKYWSHKKDCKCTNPGPVKVIARDPTVQVRIEQTKALFDLVITPEIKAEYNKELDKLGLRPE
jgi:hypothetical protein